MNDDAAPSFYITDPMWSKRVLQWQEIGAQAVWTDTLANPIEMEMMRDVAVRGVRVMFRSYVAAGGPQVGHMETPDTWWDHWKEEHPRILAFFSPLMGSPVFKYEEHKFFARMCPHLYHGAGVDGKHEYWVSDAATPTDD